MKDASEGREPWRKAVFHCIKKKKKSGSPESKNCLSEAALRDELFPPTLRSTAVILPWPLLASSGHQCCSHFQRILGFSFCDLCYLYSKRISRHNQCKSWIKPVNCKPRAETDCVSGAMMESRRGAKRWENPPWAGWWVSAATA